MPWFCVVWFAIRPCLVLVNQPGRIGVAQSGSPAQDRTDTPPRDGRGFLGAYLEDDREHQTVFIVEVVEGSPAALAGLKKGDRIKRIYNVEIWTREHVWQELGWVKPGQPVELLIRRGKGMLTFKIVLAKWPTAKPRR